MKKIKLHLAVVCCAAAAAFTLAITGLLQGATIVGSKHDFSRGSTNFEACIFCHTPHWANPLADAPLWNRFVDTAKVYTVYSSATMDTTPGNPASTVSALCLACHDGSIASGIVIPSLGVTGDDKHALVSYVVKGQWLNLNPCTQCHFHIPKVGTDLSNDHPIAMTYPTSAQDPAFNTPPNLQSGWTDVKLFHGKVECPTCHNAHDPVHAPFLRKDNTASAMCVTCHVK